MLHGRARSGAAGSAGSGTARLGSARSGLARHGAAVEEDDLLTRIAAAHVLARRRLPVGIEGVAGRKAAFVNGMHGHSFGVVAGAFGVAGAAVPRICAAGSHSMESPSGWWRTVHGGRKRIRPGAVASQ